MFDARPHEYVIIYFQGRLNLVPTLPAVFPKLEECMHQHRLAPCVLSGEERARGNKASDESASITHTHTHAQKGNRQK